jgi:hypothetical protein
LSNNLSGIVATIFADNVGESAEGTGKSLNSEGGLAGHALGEIVNGEGHTNLSIATTVDGLMVFAGGDEDTDGVVEGTLSFIEDVLSGTAEHDGASLIAGATRELDNLVLANHDLFNRAAGTEGSCVFGVIESGEDFRAQNSGKALNSIEVSMLDDHYTSLSEELLGVVVDKLTVDKYVGLVSEDLIDLKLHFALFCLLNIGDTLQGVDANLGAHNFDLIVIHGGIGNHNAGVSSHTLAASGDILLENHTVGDEGVSESTTAFLDKLNVVEVSTATEAEDSADGEFGKLFAIMEQELGAEGGEGDVLEVLTECFLIIKVVHRDIFQNLLRNIAGLAPSLDNNLGVNFVLDQFFSFAEEFTSEHGDSGGSITYLLVLGAGDVDKNAGSRVINVDGLENSSAIISDGDPISG